MTGGGDGVSDTAGGIGTGDARARLTEALSRTASQDTRAFNRVYRMTSAKLFGICLRICGERKAAEDVLQEVYLSVWVRAGGYDPARGSAIAWLSAVARNRAIDWRRRHPARATRPVEEAEAIADDAPLASDLMLRSEADRKLHLCLDALEPRQRIAIRTAFFEGLTYAELAARDATPLGTIKSWVRRGLMRLKECLDADS
jgi:RNA polymerase sigma factor (sigma-70 family)